MKLPYVPIGFTSCTVSGVEDSASLLPDFLATPGRHVVFWAPALELVIWDPWMKLGLDWLVVAGEAGPDARPFKQEWARHAIQSGARWKVPVYVVQMGSNCRTWSGIPICHRDKAGAQPAQWPREYRVRQYPTITA